MSERKDQELTIITKARDLVDETMSRTKKFDKRLRFTLSNRIDEKALDVLEAIVEANEINPAIETDPQRRAHALHGDCRQLVAKYDQQFLSIFERRPEHVQEDQHSGRGC